MIDKTVVNEHIHNFENFKNELTMNLEVLQLIEDLNVKSQDFSMKVLTIGSFSAGKSALINFLLDEDILTEEQTPETAIATELSYHPIESYEVVTKTKERKYVDEQQIQMVNPNDYLNIRYNLNNAFLQQFKDYVFVDMPGFNSNVEQHNRAILQYVENGSAYLLVIDCEDGGMKASVLQFVEEIRNYDQNVIIVLSKVDKKTTKDVLTIEQKIKTQASYLFGYDVPVVKYSKHEPETKQNVVEAIHTLNSQQIFDKAFMPKVQQIYRYIEMMLQQLIQSLTFDDEALREEIHKRQKAKSDLEYKLVQERSKLTNRMKSQVLPGIIAEVENSLFNHSTELASAAISGSQAFSMRINAILRPVLLENTKKYTDISFEEFLNEMDLSNVLADKTDEIVQSMTEKIRKVETLLSQSKETADNFNKVYKSVTGVLAIATTAVAPWLEIIILFLPEILKVFGVGGKDSQISKVKQSIESEIIPQVIGKLRPAVEESLVDMEQMMIEELEESLALIISIEEEALQATLQEREQLQISHDEKRFEYEESLNYVQNELKTLEKLVNV